jgi:dihydrofolate reductase
MRLSILVALSENGVIGSGGELPWRLPAELRRVKELTMGHCLLMGRRTFESIGRPLPGRTSIVISRNPDFHPEGTIVVDGFEAAVAAAREREEEEAFVFGGAQVYADAVDHVDRLYLTRVHTVLEGDVYFPSIGELPSADSNDDPATTRPTASTRPAPSDWQLISEEHHPADERHAYAFTFQTFDRRAAGA